MPSMTSFLRALGNQQAIDNAAVACQVRVREEWLVAGLARRLDRHEGRSQIASGDDSGVPTQVAV